MCKKNDVQIKEMLVFLSKNSNFEKCKEHVKK